MTLDLVAPDGSCPPVTVAAMLRAQAHQHPNDIALIAPGRSGMLYRELWAQAQALAPAWCTLAAGERPRIAVALAQAPEMAAAFVAVACSATCVPLDPAARPAELRALLATARVHAVLLEAQGAAAARDVALALGLPVIEVAIDRAAPAGTLRLVSAVPPAVTSMPQAEPDDTAIVLRTSGSTGEPKLVELAQAAVLASARDVIAHFKLSRTDRCLNARPLFHVNGLVTNVLATLASGGLLVFASMHEPEVYFDAIVEFDPTWFSGVPTMHQWFLAHGEMYRRKAPRHRFRFVRAGAAALSPATMHKLEALTGAPVIESYGMTERSPITASPLPPGIRKAGSVGVPLGVEVVLFDSAGGTVAPGGEGEVAIRGPVAGVAPGQWFRTGDLGRFDDDGYLCLTGRVKDLINRGGQKLLPREIDDALLEHPGVAQAAVFRVPHPTLGEDVAAAIVAAAGQAPRPAELREFLLSRLAPYKVPASFTFVDALPVGATGKVRRDALPALLTAHTVPPAADATDALGATEHTIAAIVAELLGITAVSRHDSFFALGGDSLAGARVVARVGQAFGIEPPVDLLFRHPSVAEMSLAVDALVAQSQHLVAQIASLGDDEVMRLLAQEEASGR